MSICLSNYYFSLSRFVLGILSAFADDLLFYTDCLSFLFLTSLDVGCK